MQEFSLSRLNLTRNRQELDDDDGHPARQIRRHDEREPLGDGSILLLLRWPQPQLGPADGHEHGYVRVRDESERGRVDSAEDDHRVLPAFGERVVDL